MFKSYFLAAIIFTELLSCYPGDSTYTSQEERITRREEVYQN